MLNKVLFGYIGLVGTRFVAERPIIRNSKITKRRCGNGYND